MTINLFEELLAKQMTRKEFLLHIGLVLLMISGVSSLIKILSDPHLATQSKPSRGFGSGVYGGVKKG